MHWFQLGYSSRGIAGELGNWGRVGLGVAGELGYSLVGVAGRGFGLGDTGSLRGGSGGFPGIPGIAPLLYFAPPTPWRNVPLSGYEWQENSVIQGQAFEVRDIKSSMLTDTLGLKL